MKATKALSIISILLVGIACSDMIEYSPYDANIQGRNLNAFYSENLSTLPIEKDTLTFAIFSDSHFYYDELTSAINSINKNPNIAFVVACGDITDSGLAKEYQLFWKQAKKLTRPLITIAGNHDHLSHGATIFNRMFGNPNFSFVCGDYKFIGFNDVIWENDNKIPDFNWLKKEINESDNRCVVFSHIPPWADQFTPELSEQYYDACASEQVILNMHGHEHRFSDKTIYNKRYIAVEEVFENRYYLVHLSGDEVELQVVDF